MSEYDLSDAITETVAGALRGLVWYFFSLRQCCTASSDTCACCQDSRLHWAIALNTTWH